MNLNSNFAKNYFFQSLGVLLLVVISTCFANGQSKDIKNPTPLTTNVISGTLNENTKDNIYRYYSFSANSGEVTITATVERNTNIDVPLNAGSVEFTLYDSNLEIIAQKLTGFGGGFDKGTNSVKVKIDKRKTLILGVKILGGNWYLGVGKYNLQINGAEFEASDDNKQTEFQKSLQATLSAKSINVPNKGTLIMDYSGQSTIIKLAYVKSIQIYDPTNQFNQTNLNYGKITFPSQGKLSISLKDNSALLSFDLSQVKGFALVEEIIIP